MADFLETITTILGGDEAKHVMDSLIGEEESREGQQVEGGGCIGEDVQHGIDTSLQEIQHIVERFEEGEMSASVQAQIVEEEWREQFETEKMCTSHETFGTFVGVQIAKDALLTAAIKSLEKVGASLPAGDARVSIIQAINNAAPTIKDALYTWSKWQAAHYNNREEYGSLSIEGVSFSLYQEFYTTISSLGRNRDQLLPLLNTAKEAQSLDAIKALLAAHLEYVQRIEVVSNQIDSNLTAMATAGLPAKLAEIQGACSTLVAASS